MSKIRSNSSKRRRESDPPERESDVQIITADAFNESLKKSRKSRAAVRPYSHGVDPPKKFRRKKTAAQEDDYFAPFRPKEEGKLPYSLLFFM